MSKGFTPTEEVVLYGLVKHPTLNDRQLSEVINVKPSTTTAIRRRLREKEVYSTRRIIMGGGLGYEILSVFCGEIGASITETVRQKLLKTIHLAHPIFYALEAPDSVFAMGYFRDFSEYRSFTDAAWDKLGSSDLFECERWSWALFSLRNSRILRFFDYGPALRHVFGIKERTKFVKSPEKTSKERLSKKEKSVLQGLVNCPESSDKEVAQKIGASRQAVSSMKKRFEEKGLIRTIRVVDLSKVGYSILALAHNTFSPKASVEVRWPQLLKIDEMIPQFLNVTSNPESILFASATDYDTYRILRREALKLYSEKGYFRKDPFLTLFPLPETRIVKNLDFSGFAEGIV